MVYILYIDHQLNLLMHEKLGNDQTPFQEFSRGFPRHFKVEEPSSIIILSKPVIFKCLFVSREEFMRMHFVT